MAEVSNIPLHPPVDWFSPPSDIPTDRRLTITADGRVFGYIALWDQCHAGASGCVRPPKGSPTGYEYAHQGFTLTADGSEIRTAVIAGGTVHAAANESDLRVPEHYENTGKQMMRVRYGEDQNGIWFAGALWPDLDPMMIEKLRASSISGDWRFSAGWRAAQKGEYDFAGACLVNLPGFPTPTDENSVYKRAGQAYSLVASATQSEIEIVMVDDVLTAYDENYPCEQEESTEETIVAAQEDPTKQKYTPPKGVQSAMKKGLRWYEAGHGGSGLVDKTIREARSIARGEAQPYNKLVRMRAWFARHSVNEGAKNQKSSDPTPHEVAWALWGGDAGRSWSEDVVGRAEKAKKSMKASGEDMSEETENTEENVEAAADTENPQAADEQKEVEINDGSDDYEITMNMKLDELLTRVATLETMISEAEAERLLKQVMMGDEE